MRIRSLWYGYGLVDMTKLEKESTPKTIEVASFRCISFHHTRCLLDLYDEIWTTGIFTAFIYVSREHALLFDYWIRPFEFVDIRINA